MADDKVPRGEVQPPGLEPTPGGQAERDASTSPGTGAPAIQDERRRFSFGALVAELKRRRVFRVMVGYGVFSFAVLQVIEPIMHGAHLGDWVLTAVLVALAIGLPVAVMLSWLFDLTAEGVQRTPSATGSRAIALPRGRLAAILVGVGLVAALPGVAWYAWRWAGRPAAEPPAAISAASIAVLPFADLSPNHDQDYFSDGVAEEILNALARVDGLRVPARASSFWFKGKSAEPAEIAGRLGVAHLLEGSVRRSGTRLRISAEVVKVASGDRLWSQTFDREAADVFAVQDEIARAVVDALKVRLMPGQGTVAPANRSRDPEAFRLYLLGKQLHAKDTEADRDAAVTALREAARLDPGFIPARAWLVEAEVDRMDMGPADIRRMKEPIYDSDLVLPEARRTADELVALGPDVAEAHRLRAYLRFSYFWNWAGALEDLGRARALAPGDLDSQLYEARVKAATGRMTEALEDARRLAADNPLVTKAYQRLGQYQCATGHADQAALTAQRGLEVAPNQPYLLQGLGVAKLLLGDGAGAAAVFDGIPVGWMRLTGLAITSHTLGRETASRQAIDQLVARCNDGNGPWYQLGEVHAWRGENDLAFQWLDRAFVHHDPGLEYVRYDPLLRGLRTDRRFAALLERMGLPPLTDEVGPPPATATTRAPSIAVLPFADMSEKHDQEYFADGVAEEILNALAHVPGLKVIGRTSSFSFKGSSDDLRAIGSKLGVAHVLEGSLRKDGRDVRVTAKLVSVADGSQLWSETYDRRLTGILKVQEEISTAVVAVLRVRLGADRGPPFADPRPVDPRAYNEYLLGLRFQNQASRDALVRSVASYERALALDGRFAEAAAHLAIVRYLLADIETDPDAAREGFRTAMEAAEQAIALDPRSATGHAIRGYLRLSLKWNWGGAQEDVARAVALAPGNAYVQLTQGQLLQSLGRLEAAIASTRRATELDPLDPTGWWMESYLQTGLGRYDEASRAARRSMEVAPDDSHGPRNLGYALLLQRRLAEARAAFERCPLPGHRLLGEALVQHALGRPREARAALDRLIADFHRSMAYQVGQVYARLGERDRAFEWLERARVQHDTGLADYVTYDPLLRDLRGDPRYAALLGKMKLPVD